MNMHTRGFTLIEIMVAVSLFAILVLLAAPTYSDFLGNTQIRNAAENALAGVRLAQTMAVKTNRPAKVVITPATGWDVFLFDEALADYATAPLESYRWAAGSSRAVVTLGGGGTEVAFDGLGRVCTTVLCTSAGAATSPVTEIDVTNPSVGSPRPLKVMISSLGGTTGTKLCDPAVLPPDARSCS